MSEPDTHQSETEPGSQDASGFVVEDKPPRWFWRRAFAFVIDYFAVSVVVAIIAIMASRVLPVTFAGSALNFSTCLAGGEPPQHIADAFPVRDGEVRHYVVCDITSDLFLHYRVHRVGISKPLTDGVQQTYFVEFASDENDNEIKIFPTSIFVVLLFPFAMAGLTANTGFSPGKRILSLQVLDMDEAPPGFRRSLAREALKILPLLVFVLSSAWQYITMNMSTFADNAATIRQLADNPGGSVFDLIPAWTFVVMIAAGIFNLVWWFGPFIVWRGATFYDRIMGTRVYH